MARVDCSLSLNATRHLTVHQRELETGAMRESLGGSLGRGDGRGHADHTTGRVEHEPDACNSAVPRCAPERPFLRSQPRLLPPRVRCVPLRVARSELPPPPRRLPPPPLRPPALVGAAALVGVFGEGGAAFAPCLLLTRPPLGEGGSAAPLPLPLPPAFLPGLPPVLLPLASVLRFLALQDKGWAARQAKHAFTCGQEPLAATAPAA